VLSIDQISRVELGTFLRPGSETPDGRLRAEVAMGYLVRHPHGMLLFDTGIGAVDADTEVHYRPVRRPLAAALRQVGAALADVAVVVNCHLHFDHCGGNRLLTHRPVFAQRAEYVAALEEGYTNPALIDYDGAHYELLDGETEILPGAHVIPTPGHTTGHQSLALRCDDGTVVLAGQSHDHASDYTADELARRARAAGHPQPLPDYPSWLDRLLELDPRRILFAHDLAVWEPH
jgi:glyoxylase-like metal-dependent hydrolase (beta-lactamase superfamily II)